MNSHGGWRGSIVLNNALVLALALLSADSPGIEASVGAPMDLIGCFDLN